MACCGERPVGFSPGTSWTFPLVDPLADDVLIVPVYIENRGPFLFALDPGNISRVDREALALSGSGPDITLSDVRIGSLTVSHVTARTIGAHDLDAFGRRVVGTLGREVFGDGVVFGFDRARGIAWVSTRSGFHAPEHARVVELEPRTRVKARIDGTTRDLAVDLGHVTSTMAPELWPAGATWTAREVDVTEFEQANLVFEPRPANARVLFPIDGTLGLGFFELETVAIDPGRQRMYLEPRASERGARAVRLARWGASIASCKWPGCAQLDLTERELHVRPETPARAVELVVRARGRDGVLPDLEINLAAGAEPFAAQLDPRYADAELEVIDASPFPRTCVAAPACVVAMDVGRE